ncbi:MAG: hypothetical protein WBE61_14975 [Nitrososphaeraceae archaeon]
MSLFTREEFTHFLDITQATLEQYIMPHDYEKPRIEIGNYYLKWDDKSSGISQKEISELKGFLKDTIPHFDVIYDLINSLETSRGKDKRRAHKELSPHIHLSQSNKDRIVRYDLYMGSDGSTFIDRTERFEIINKGESGYAQRPYVKSELFLKWSLGELLFNRQGVVRFKE